MKIPERLAVLASRIGNKTMIDNILKAFPELNDDDCLLVDIVPERKGIAVLNTKSNQLHRVGYDVGTPTIHPEVEASKKAARRK